MDTSDIAIRMKKYEKVSKTVLMNRTPVVIRLDGKAFHSFTKGFQRPFDTVFMTAMQETMKYLCQNIQGVVLGYTQSDEITLILQDYKTFSTSAWFDYEVQKLCSISASMATMAFNKAFSRNVEQWRLDNELDLANVEANQKKLADQYIIYNNAIDKGAMFDSRCFNIPFEEVTNLVYWRQLDASRNSIQMVGQANFSFNELQNKSCSDIQDMLMKQKGINWNNLPTTQKRGSCCIKEEYMFIEEEFIPDSGRTVQLSSPETRTRWIIDDEIPIFKGDGREYIESRLNIQ